MTVAFLAAAVALAVLGLLVVGLLRSHAEILRPLRGTEETPGPDPGPGAGPAAGPAAAGRDVPGTTLDDEVVRIGVVGARHGTLLAFLSSGCFTCGEFWETFRRARRLAVPGGARLVIVTKDPAEESPSRLRELAPTGIPLVMSSAAWEGYGVTVAPYFVYVDGPSGEIRGAGVAQDWDQVVARWTPVAEGPGDRPAAPGRGARGGRARQAEVDARLREAGMGPADPSLRRGSPEA